MELFVLGLVFGAATAQGKAVTKAVAKGYMAVSEKTREVVSTLKEDMRGAIEEARVERDQEVPEVEPVGHQAEALALREETSTGEPVQKKVNAAPAAATIPAAAASTVTTKQSPTVMKSFAKKYMAMTEKTREAVSGIRENVRDAIEEARYERELAAQRAAEAESEAATVVHNAAAAEVAPVEIPAPVKAKSTPITRSTRRKAPVAQSAAETPKPARSTRTKTEPLAAVVTAPTPAKRGRPRKVKPNATPTEALLEVAEIAADAL